MEGFIETVLRDWLLAAELRFAVFGTSFQLTVCMALF